MDTIYPFFYQWKGAMIAIGGIYWTLVAYGYWPRNPENPERLRTWRENYGPLRVFSIYVDNLTSKARLNGQNILVDQAFKSWMERTFPRP